MTGSLLIKNVWLADGSSSPLRKAACLVGMDGRIAAVEKEFSACAAERILEGRGAILAPGFIDAHGHSDLSGISAPECFSKISQGITTEICGNCGLSAFPVAAGNHEHLQELYKNYQLELSWKSCEEYLEYCCMRRCRIQLVPLCGHNTLRAAVRGYGDGEAAGKEIEKMTELLERELLNGAAGVSFGLLYTPGIFASAGEIAALMKSAAEYDRISCAHLRSEGDGLIESLSEMIELSHEAGAKSFHVSHLKTSGEANYGKIDRVFELFEEAQNKGLRITCDRYPYTESMTQFSVVLPGEWKELDDVALRKKLADDEAKKTLITDLRQAKEETWWQCCRLVNCSHPAFMPFRGKKITDIPGDTVENAVEMLAFDPVNCQAAFSVMSEENMKRILLSPCCVAGSDGNALPADARFGHSHPRSFGAIARFLRLLLDWGETPEMAVRKCSGLTAEIFRLHDRGRIAPGVRGDLVVFDPDSIDGKADFSAPETPAEGVIYTIVNGEVVYS